MTLAQKRVVVIGGSSGMGFATANAAAQENAEVIIASRSSEKLSKALAAIGNNATSHVLDFTDEEALKNFFTDVGALDHLVITAADVAFGPFVELDTHIARHFFDSKFWGQYNTAKYAAPYIKKGGSITLFAGKASQLPRAGFACGAAINGAIEALGRALALELAPVRVNTVSPGVVHTEVWNIFPKAAQQEKFDLLARRLPVGRIGKPEDVAQAVLYLMSNGYTTGTTLFIDGGEGLVVD